MSSSEGKTALVVPTTSCSVHVSSHEFNFCSKTITPFIPPTPSIFLNTALVFLQGTGTERNSSNPSSKIGRPGLYPRSSHSENDELDALGSIPSVAHRWVDDLMKRSHMW
ncbi:unnamed protein product [Cuscuta campestris]|uniref:Uncharacterized protein n=1 Tax=Cuscuta campestris TaxID=132261 RepID=A0A484N0T8_9ASTE|nr:unnamed protein product [Cuscuta campestris]